MPLMSDLQPPAAHPELLLHLYSDPQIHDLGLAAAEQLKRGVASLQKLHVIWLVHEAGVVGPPQKEVPLPQRRIQKETGGYRLYPLVALPVPPLPIYVHLLVLYGGVAQFPEELEELWAPWGLALPDLSFSISLPDLRGFPVLNA